MGFEGDNASYEEMAIRECDPPRTLKVTSNVGPYVWYLDVELSEADGVTTLAFSQPDLDHDDSLSVGPGWEFYLDRLVAVETGGDRRRPPTSSATTTRRWRTTTASSATLDGRAIRLRLRARKSQQRADESGQGVRSSMRGERPGSGRGS